MRAAAIDVGTNSIKMAVGDTDAGGAFRVIHDSTLIARMGEGVDTTHKINPQAMDRTAAAISELAQQARSLRAKKIGAVGTSARAGRQEPR